MIYHHHHHQHRQNNHQQNKDNRNKKSSLSLSSSSSLVQLLLIKCFLFWMACFLILSMYSLFIQVTATTPSVVSSSTPSRSSDDDDDVNDNNHYSTCKDDNNDPSSSSSSSSSYCTTSSTSTMSTTMLKDDEEEEDDEERIKMTDETTVTSTTSSSSSSTTITLEDLATTADDLVQRINDVLKASGLLLSSEKNKELIEKISLEQVHLYYNEKEEEIEEEQTKQARELLLLQRQRQRQQQQQQQQQQNINSNIQYNKNIDLPEYPYEFVPPPPPIKRRNQDRYHYSLDLLVQDYKPRGGYRYTEYITGSSPYKITSTIREQSDTIARLRRPYIKEAMQYAWDGYKKYAYGYDEVRPQSKKGTNHWGGIAVSLVDSLDTLFIMGMYNDFIQARDYVRDVLDHNQNKKVSVFETTIRSLGGLLAAYDISRDIAFLNEALDLARRLMRAFVHPVTGDNIYLPFGEVNLQNGSCNMIPWTGGNAILSEFGTLQIEFRYLDYIVQTSETREFRDKTEQIFQLLYEMSPENGLYPYYMKTKHEDRHINDDAGKSRSQSINADAFKKHHHGKQLSKPYFSNDHYTFGAMADSFYEYMLKIWIQGGKVEPMYRDMYDKAMQGMHDELLHMSTPSGLIYLADKVGTPGRSRKRTKHKMDHLVCFTGGMLALGAYTDPLGLDSYRAQRDLQTAKALTYTCYQMYARMKTGISPEYVEFVAGKDFRVGPIAPHYLLRPEAIESFYILNALTGDPIYREWGWEIFLSIEKYCKTHAAYGSLGNVQDQHSPPRDDMESFFLAETMKYLYLLNDPDSELDILKKHVFNTEAHPLRTFPVIQEELQNRQSES